MFQMLGVFAEFERALTQERVRAGLARARSEGKRLGRPPNSRGDKTGGPFMTRGGSGVCIGAAEDDWVISYSITTSAKQQPA